MAIANLTNTKWVLNNTLNIPNSNLTYYINFSSGGYDWQKFNLMTGNELAYSDDTLQYDNGWNHGAEIYRIISITGGTDVTNSSLISWLEANATQVQVDDLTNTKWVMNTTPNIDTTQVNSHTFNINFTSYSVQSNPSYNHLIYGALYDSDFGENIAYIKYERTDLTYENAYYNENWDNAYKTIEITNGTDTTNPDLIAWLTQNATLQQPIPTKTFDLSTLQLSAGTHVVQVRARAQGYKDSNFSNSVSYVVAQPSYTINFSITSESHTDYKYAFRIYDGQDNTGNLLYESTSGATLTPQTLTCLSGYLTFEFERAESGDPCSFSFTNTGGVSPASAGDNILGVHDETFAITGDGTITIDYIDWDD